MGQRISRKCGERLFYCVQRAYGSAWQRGGRATMCSPSFPKYGPPYPSSSPSSSSACPASASMDDLAHESLPVHSLSRKRKADGDDCQVQDAPSSSDPSSTCEPMLIDSSATPRCPSKTSDHTQTPAWLLADAEQGIVSSWSQPSPASSAVPFLSDAQKEGPSRPKRPRIDIPPSSPAARRVRRGRALYSHSVPSPRRHSRRARLGETRDTGIVSATEPGPSRGSLLRYSSLPSTPRPVSSLPVSPIEPIPHHIPPHQPPINRDTLKELDLEAILRNPQLRSSFFFSFLLRSRPSHPHPSIRTFRP